MSAASTSDDKINVGPQSVPTLNVRDVDHDANENIISDSSERSNAHVELKSGIITEGDSKSRQRSGRSRNSSGEYSKLQSRCVMINSSRLTSTEISHVDSIIKKK